MERATACRAIQRKTVCPYQVNGRISGLRIYNRVVTAEEAAGAFKQKPADPE